MDKDRTIYAGSHPFCEIVRSTDGHGVTIRLVESPSKGVSLPTSVIPTLIRSLEEVYAAAYGPNARE